MPVTSLLLLRITPHKPRSWAGSRAARRVSTGEPRGHVNKGCVLGLTSVFPGFSTDGTCEALWFLFLSVWFLFLSVSASRCLPVVLAFWIPLVSDRLSGVTIIIIIIMCQWQALAGRPHPCGILAQQLNKQASYLILSYLI